VETHKAIRGKMPMPMNIISHKRMEISCGLYYGRTFDATKLAISEMSPSSTEAELELYSREI
jgi:hypothetical protein